MHIEQDEQLRRDYARSLSFQDGFFNRWERAERLGFGQDTQVYNSVQVFGDVAIGRSTFVGAFCILDGGYAPVRIGDYVSISAGVHVYSHDTVLWSLTGGKADKRSPGPPLKGSPLIHVRAFTLFGGAAVKEREPERNLIEMIRNGAGTPVHT